MVQGLTSSKRRADSLAWSLHIGTSRGRPRSTHNLALPAEAAWGVREAGWGARLGYGHAKVQGLGAWGLGPGLRDVTMTGVGGAGVRGCWPMPSRLACLSSIHAWPCGANSGGQCTERRLGHRMLLHSVGRETEAVGPGACSGTHSLQLLWGLRLKTELAAPSRF